MKKTSIILTGIVLVAFTLFSFLGSSNSNVIWNGTGEATQSIRLGLVNKGSETTSKISYTFNHVRLATMIDSGSFSLSTQPEVNVFISDLKGAIAKVADAAKTEYSRGKYTISVGGSSSKVKNHFRIEVGDKFCPIHKKDAKKLIKVLEPKINDFAKN